MLLVVLLVESTKAFRAYDEISDRYIYRYLKLTADSELSYRSKAKIIYVQLDKCLAQFKEGQNGEVEDGKPDKLQTWLAMIADVNDGQVSKAAECDDVLINIRTEALVMGQSKEALMMLFDEEFARMVVRTKSWIKMRLLSGRSHSYVISRMIFEGCSTLHLV